MCTILTNLAKVDFGELDPDDEDLLEIHYMFAHSPITGVRNYALQRSNALREISHTSVASSQRVCLAYHASLQLLHPNMLKDSHPVSGKVFLLVSVDLKDCVSLVLDISRM